MIISHARLDQSLALRYVSFCTHITLSESFFSSSILHPMDPGWRLSLLFNSTLRYLRVGRTSSAFFENLVQDILYFPAFWSVVVLSVSHFPLFSPSCRIPSHVYMCVKHEPYTWKNPSETQGCLLWAKYNCKRIIVH